MTLRTFPNPFPWPLLKAGLSQATGYRLQADPILPSQKTGSAGQDVVPEPASDIFFDTGCCLLLKSSPGSAPGLRSSRSFSCADNPDLSAGIRRPLERRYGPGARSMVPEHEVIFRQIHVPGNKMGLSGLHRH